MKDVETQSHVLREIDQEFKDIDFTLFFRSVCLSWVLYTFMSLAVVLYYPALMGTRLVLGCHWLLWGLLIIGMLLSGRKKFILKWEKVIAHGVALVLMIVTIVMWGETFSYTDDGLPAAWLVFLPMFLLFYLSVVSFLLYALALIIVFGILVNVYSPSSLAFFQEETVLWSDFSRITIIYTGLVIVGVLGKYTFSRELGNIVKRFVVLNNKNKDLLQKQKKIYYNAYYDFLTGLYNRSMMENKIMEAIKIAQDDASTIAVLFIDLDNFKRINDNFGHRVGDYTLFALATRLRKALYDDWFKAHTQNNENKGFLARLSGDEFIVVLVDVEQKRVKTICRNLVRACAKAYTIPDIKKAKMPRLSVSIGAAYMKFFGDKIYNRRQDKILIRRNLLRQSDKGMYIAKRKKNTFHFLEY